jgi:hypothetical protein
MGELPHFTEHGPVRVARPPSERQTGLPARKARAERPAERAGSGVPGAADRVTFSAVRGGHSGQQPVRQGVSVGGGTAGRVELYQDGLDIVLGGAPADEQGLAYGGVGGAVGCRIGKGAL